jgi:hypothetical protein
MHMNMSVRKKRKARAASYDWETITDIVEKKLLELLH